MKTEQYEFNGFTAVVIRPDEPNGKWIWKTEFLYAFDAAERELVEKHGYTRVYYGVSDMYGSARSVRLMHAFHLDLVERYALDMRPTLFGFSRGGLYAFNYVLFYPDLVDKVYLDAPVLDLKTWPTARHPKERAEMLAEYFLTEETLPAFRGSPIDMLDEYFSHGIPTLLVAGDSDQVVPFPENSEKMINYCARHGIPLPHYVKPGCLHHPHSLEDDVTPIIKFVTE